MKCKKDTKESKSVIDTLEKRVEQLEEFVKILLDKVKELEEHKNKSETKQDQSIRQPKQHASIINETVQETNDKGIMNCKECEEVFANKDGLKIHIKEMHVKSFKCKSCDKTFDARWKLESHLQIQHETRKMFKCDHCKKEFLLKWRLNQHVRGHKEMNKKFCHYFNNDQICPFDDIGCKFRHDVSDTCNFGKSCLSHLYLNARQASFILVAKL